MSVIDECLEEINAEKALAHGVCPVVEILYRGAEDKLSVFDDVTIFCTRCPDAEDIPDECPELAGGDGRVRACILYNALTERRRRAPQGKCPYAQPSRKVRCTCFAAKSAEWHKAFDAWNESRNVTRERWWKR